MADPTAYIVQCPDCRASRSLSFYGARSIRAGETSGRCRPCAYQRLNARRVRLARAAFAERFWAKVEKTDGCWLWKPAKTNEYGRFMIRKGRLRGAHRVSWEMARGPIPDGLFVLHDCDNPRCVNPDHLFLGTAGDNSRDMVAKGRKRGGRKPVTVSAVQTTVLKLEDAT